MTMATLLGPAFASRTRLSTICTRARIQTAIIVHVRVKMSSLWASFTSSSKSLLTLPLGQKSTSNAPEEPRSLPSSGFTTISNDQLVEEEELPDYRADRFYPVRLGEIFQNRFQIVAKLGFGSSSTTWLARDLMWACTSFPLSDVWLTIAELITMLRLRYMCILRRFIVKFHFTTILPAASQVVHIKDGVTSGDC